MTRLYLDIHVQFEFETTLDGSAIPVARDHLNRLLCAHEGVHGFQILSVERVQESLVRFQVQLLLEEEFGPAFHPDQVGASLHELAGASYDLFLRNGPLSLTRLHRARVLS